MGYPLNVLVVEADPDICAIIEISLQLNPAFFSAFVPSAEAALTLIEGNYRFDMALFDTHVPDTTPLAFMARVAAVPQAPAVVFLSTDTREQTVAMLRDAGARGVIAKPFNPLTLTEQLTIVAGRE